MNIIRLYILFNFVNNNARYLLVQINKENVGKVQLKSRAQMDNDSGTSQISFRSDDARIVGGNEIKPHSQPWLALLCDEIHNNMW